MSFMAGFGQAFSKSYEAERERGAQEKRDMLRMQYDDYKSNRDSENERKKRDGEAKSLAERIVAQRKLPAEVAGDVYTWIKMGLDGNDINKRLDEGVFEKVDPETGKKPMTSQGEAVQGGPAPAQEVIEPAPPNPTSSKIASATGVQLGQPNAPATGAYKGPALSATENVDPAPTVEDPDTGPLNAQPEPTGLAAPTTVPMGTPPTDISKSDVGLASPESLQTSTPMNAPTPSAPVAPAPQPMGGVGPNPTPMVPPPAPMASGSVPIPSPRPPSPQMGQEMASMGAPVPTQPVPPTPAPAAPTAPPKGLQHAGLLSAQSKKFTDFFKPKGSDGGVSEIARITGRDPEEVKRIMNGSASAEASPYPTTSGYMYKSRESDPYSQKDGTVNSLDEAIAAQQTAQELGDLPKVKYYGDLRKQYEDAEDRSSARKALENGHLKQDFFHGAVVDKNGNYVSGIPLDNNGNPDESRPLSPGQKVHKISKAEDDEEKEARRDATPEIKAASGRQDAFVDLLSNGKEMVAIVENNPDLLAKQTTSLVSWASQAANEFSVSAGIFDQALKNNEVLTPENLDMMKQEAALIENSISQNKFVNVADRIKADNDLLQTRKAIFAYQMGMAMGQTGRSLAETERLMFANMGAAGNKPEVFRQNIANITKAVHGSVDRAANSAVKQNQLVKDFREKWGRGTVMEKNIRNIDQELQQNDDLRDFWNSMKNTNTTQGNVLQANPESQKKYPTPIQKDLDLLRDNPKSFGDFLDKFGPEAGKYAPKISNVHIETLKSNPQKFKKHFDDTYWPGAADFYLKGN